jgi:hypothetical protein
MYVFVPVTNCSVKKLPKFKSNDAVLKAIDSAVTLPWVDPVIVKLWLSELTYEAVVARNTDIEDVTLFNTKELVCEFVTNEEVLAFCTYPDKVDDITNEEVLAFCT